MHKSAQKDFIFLDWWNMNQTPLNVHVWNSPLRRKCGYVLVYKDLIQHENSATSDSSGTILK